MTKFINLHCYQTKITKETDMTNFASLILILVVIILVNLSH
jgi:hypothetical protein